MKIYAPVKNYTGISANVQFVNGVGECNTPHVIEWFRSKGYRVEGDTLETFVEEEKIKEELENLENLESKSNRELKDILDKKGIEYRAKANKAELIDLLK